MAATSILYHTLGLVGYRHCSTEYREGKLLHFIERAPCKRKCANCGASHGYLTLDGQFERTFIGLPVGRKRQEVVLRGHIQVCAKCGARVREPLPFAKGKARYIKAFARLVVDMCGITTIRNVARFLGVGWDLVKGIFKADLGQRLKRRKLRKIRYIAVDEFATHKGHKYMTVVLDLDPTRLPHDFPEEPEFPGKPGAGGGPAEPAAAPVQDGAHQRRVPARSPGLNPAPRCPGPGQHSALRPTASAPSAALAQSLTEGCKASMRQLLFLVWPGPGEQKWPGSRERRRAFSCATLRGEWLPPSGCGVRHKARALPQPRCRWWLRYEQVHPGFTRPVVASSTWPGGRAPFS